MEPTLLPLSSKYITECGSVTAVSWQSRYKLATSQAGLLQETVSGVIIPKIIKLVKLPSLFLTMRSGDFPARETHECCGRFPQGSVLDTPIRRQYTPSKYDRTVFFVKIKTKL